MNLFSEIQAEMQNFFAKWLIRHQSINGFKRIYFIHIRKCGGTSLNKMFLALTDDPPDQLYQQLVDSPGHLLIKKHMVFVGWNKKLINRGNYFYAFSHLPLHELRLPPHTFTITCFRDPINRVISHYKMLLNYKLNKISHPCMNVEGEWLGNSFSDFLHRIPKEHLLNQLFMFSKNFDPDEAIENIKKSVHYFFFTEEFNKGVHDLNRLLNLHLEPLHEKRSKIRLEISNEDRTFLRHMLKKEYHMLKVLKGWSAEYSS